jgi:phage/plasmid-associated DNA primase
MGKLFMMCNKLPAVKTMDRGTWRRIRVIPFVSKFVDSLHPEYIAKKPNVFLIDREMDAKLLKWRESFLSLLVHIYETEYLKNGLEPIPESVLSASNNYKESNDTFARFAADRIRKDINAKATFKEIYSAYKNWKDLSGGSAASISSQDLENRLNEEFGEPRNKKHYMGIVVLLNEDAQEEWDEGTN